MKQRLSLFLVLFLLPLITCANTANVLNTRLANLNTYSAHFKQLVYSEDGDLLQKTSGEVAIERPGKFRWVTQTPMRQVIVSNGKLLWVYEPDLEQVTIRRLQQNLGQTPLLLLTTKDVILQKQFAVKSLSASQGMQRYQLIPKSTQDGFKRIVLGFNGDKLSYLELNNQLNQTTKINFSKVVLNHKLANKLFSFSPPKGVDVVNTVKQAQ